MVEAAIVDFIVKIVLMGGRGSVGLVAAVVWARRE
jgi:hypothetical protein